MNQEAPEMGIPKLAYFMKEKKHFVSINLRHSKRKIVIDGYSLCYRLHSGFVSTEYCEFYSIVVSYFQELAHTGIEAYVVVDGVDYENRKLGTDIDRCRERIERLARAGSLVELIPPHNRTLPLLAKLVFVDAIRDTKSVKFFVADGEADRDVVSLANHLGCPVVGLDSDFFIFNIEYGYIPIVNDHKELVDLTGVVQCFGYKPFCTDWGLKNPRIRLLLPYCLGNDFHGPHSIPRLGIDMNESIETLLPKIRGANFDDFSRLVQDDQAFYEVEPRSFTQLSESKFLHEFNPLVPEWIVSAFKFGLFLPNYMNFVACRDLKVVRFVVVTEDMTQDSAWSVTDSLLPFIVGALLGDTAESLPRLTRFVREGCSCVLTEQPIEIKVKHRTILSPHTLSSIQMISNEDRSKPLLRVFHCKSIAKSLRGIPEGLQLVVIATRCWLKNIASTVDQRFAAFIIGLVCCFQICFGQISASRYDLKLAPNKMGRLRRIHYLAKWECVFHLVIAFNQILDHPFSYTSPGRLFSSKIFDNCFMDNPESLLINLDSCGKKMFEVITKGIDLPPFTAPSHRARTEALAPTVETVSTQNRFKKLTLD